MYEMRENACDTQKKEIMVPHVNALQIDEEKVWHNLEHNWNDLLDYASDQVMHLLPHWKN